MCPDFVIIYVVEVRLFPLNSTVACLLVRRIPCHCGLPISRITQLSRESYGAKFHRRLSSGTICECIDEFYRCLFEQEHEETDVLCFRSSNNSFLRQVLTVQHSLIWCLQVCAFQSPKSLHSYVRIVLPLIYTLGQLVYYRMSVVLGQSRSLRFSLFNDLSFTHRIDV